MYKVKKSMVSFILILCMLLTVGFAFCVPKTKTAHASCSETEWDYTDCVNLIRFIEKNVGTFVLEYNKTVEDGNYLFASSIEFSSVIKLVEDNNYGVYVDFNADNGYFVSTGNYNIYDLQVNGDYEFLREADNLYFSVIDGFLSKDENNMYHNLLNNNFYNTDYAVNQNCGASDVVYSGQDEPGDGKIDIANLSNYVSERYPEYTFDSKVENLANSFNHCTNQFDTSYYIKVKLNQNYSETRTTQSEGNCVLNSVYMALLSWQDMGYVTNLPTGVSNIYTSIENDPLYEYYGTGIVRQGGNDGSSNSGTGGSGGTDDWEYYKWKTNLDDLINMPILYQNIRNYAVNQYGYTPESKFVFDNIPALGQYVANTLYNNNIRISKLQLSLDALDNLDTKAIIMGINNSSTYGNHAVVVLGYHKYTYTSGWWIFSYTSYAYFFEVADGWKNDVVVFDPNTSASPALSLYYLG